MGSRYAAQAVIALFSSIGWQEMALLFFLGLLLYGRNLPDAGRKFGRVVGQLKRSFQDFKDQIDRDGEVRNVKQVLTNTAREVKGVAKVPTAIANPSNAFRELTHEALSTPIDSRDDREPTTSTQNDVDDDPVIPVDEPDVENTMDRHAENQDNDHE